MATLQPYYFSGATAKPLSATDDFAIAKISIGNAPVAANDAVNKSYADALLTGKFYEMVRVATTANIDIATGLNVGDSIDGVVLANGDRVLVKNQTTLSQNGIYIAGAAPARSADMAAASSASGAKVFVDQGTQNLDTHWVCTTDKGVDVVGTNNLTFVQYGTANVTGGDGIEVAANQVSVDLDGTAPGLEFATAKLKVKLNGTTLALAAAGLSVLGLPAAGTWQIAGVNSSANATMANLNTLVDNGDATALHHHKSGEIVTADAAIAKGDPMQVATTDGRFIKAVANGTELNSYICGVANEAFTGAGDTGYMVTAGLIPGAGVGWTRGQVVFMAGGGGGGLSQTAPNTSGEWVAPVGVALSATDLFVRIRPSYQAA